MEEELRLCTLSQLSPHHLHHRKSFAKECYMLGLLHARNARELVAFVLCFYHLA